MKIRIRSLIILICIFLSGGVLLHTSQKVELSENRLEELKQNIAQEEESIKILRTEWAFLNNPERLEVLAQKYLDVKTPEPTQMMTSATGYLQSPAADMAASEETPSAALVSDHAAVPAPAAYVTPVSDVRPQKSFNQLLQQVSDGGLR
jgi:hypothetical protein